MQGIVVKPGQACKATQVLLMVKFPARDFFQGRLFDLWAKLAPLFGGADTLHHVLKAWFTSKAVVVGGAVAFNAELISAVVEDFPPDGMLWDVGGLEDRLTFHPGEIRLVLPALRLSKWHHLHFELPFDIDFDGRIHDPRFTAEVYNDAPARGGRRGGRSQSVKVEGNGDIAMAGILCGISQNKGAIARIQHERDLLVAPVLK